MSGKARNDAELSKFYSTMETQNQHCHFSYRRLVRCLISNVTLLVMATQGCLHWGTGGAAALSAIFHWGQGARIALHMNSFHLSYLVKGHSRHSGQFLSRQFFWGQAPRPPTFHGVVKFKNKIMKIKKNKCVCIVDLDLGT